MDSAEKYQTKADSGKPRPTLDRLYDFLTALGYEICDEERMEGSKRMTGYRAAIYCPLCGRTAVCMDYEWTSSKAQYLHIWKNREVRHTVKLKPNDVKQNTEIHAIWEGART